MDRVGREVALGFNHYRGVNLGLNNGEVTLGVDHGREVALGFDHGREVALGFNHGRDVALGFDHGREGFDHRKGLGLC